MRTLYNILSEGIFDVDSNIENAGNVDFQDLLNAKNQEEFRALCDILEDNLKEKASTDPERIGVTIIKWDNLRAVDVGRVGRRAYHMIYWDEKSGLDLSKVRGRFIMEYELPKYLEKSFQELEKTNR